jgi:hypothetical protein
MGGSLVRRFCIYVVLSLSLVALGSLAPVSASTAFGAVSTVYGPPSRAEKVTVTVTDVKTVTLAQRADHVAAYWPGGKNARVTLAFSSDGTNFGKPVDAGRDDMGEELQNGMTYGAVQVTNGAIAVRVTADVPLAQFNVIGMSPGGGVPSRLLSAGVPATVAVDQPTVISRAGWNADSAYLNWAPQFYPTKKFIVHHTADNISTNGTQEYYAKLVRSIYYYHAVTQGWGDIAYNFLIDPLGNIYEGRYSDNDNNSLGGEDIYGNGVTGGHASGYNTGTVGIAVLGTYTNQDISAAARASLEKLLAWEAKKNGIDPAGSDPYFNPFNARSTIQAWNIAGHRDYSSTDCPGTAFYNTLPTIRQDVSNLTGAVTTPTLSPTYLELAASPSSPTTEQQVTITATLIEELSRMPLSGQTVSFAAGGIATDPTSLGTAITDSNGVASVQTTLTTVGMHWVTASFDSGTNTMYRGSTTSAEVNVSPTGLSATPGNAQAQLSWSAATGASGYNVYRDGAKVNSAPITSTNHLDTGLTNGVTYSYQVTAVVNGRESAKSPAVSAAPAGGGPGAPFFLDVSMSHPYYQAIQHLANAGIINGKTDGKFHPGDAVMRQQFAKMIVKTMGHDVPPDIVCLFVDVDLKPNPIDSLYPAKYVAVCALHGITVGIDATHFAPSRDVTRFQVIAMVVRAVDEVQPGLLATPSGTFVPTWDPDLSAEHGLSTARAEYSGLLAGIDLSVLDPGGDMTRGEIAQVLWNVMQKLGMR